MNYIEIIGLIAATCTTSAFVPQVYKAWRYKSTRDVSLSMYLVIVLGTVLWFIYGVYLNSISIMLANGITVILAFIVILFKVKHK